MARRAQRQYGIVMWRSAGLLAGLVAVAMGAPVAGAQEAGDQDRVRCITLSSIDRTEVIDNRTIAFFLSRGRVYLNRLDRACRNLDRNRPFGYETSTGQLCAIDTIRVIEDFGPAPSTGDICGLGDFVLTDEEEIEVLKGEREAVEVEAEEVEVEVDVEVDFDVQVEETGADD